MLRGAAAILLNRTIKLKLAVTDRAQAKALDTMMEQYRLAANSVSQYVFDHDFELNSSKLNAVLYRSTRSDFGLKSQLAQSVFRTVTARYKAVQTQLRRRSYRYKDNLGRWHKAKRDLTWLWKPIGFSRPQADLVRDRDYSFIESGSRLSLTTLDQRLKVGYTAKGFKAYLDGTWNLGTAKLLKTGHNWFLHVAVSKTVADFDVKDVKHVVGLDRGLRFLTTVYDEQGKTTFFSGKAVLRKRHKFIQRRRELQAKGTRSAKRRLRVLSGRENRWMADVNHQLSKTLVQAYGDHTLFALEDLTDVSFERNNLSKQARADNSSWSFYDLENKLAYKAANNQSMVVEVSAAYTSQRCIKCGTIDKTARHHSIHEYVCQHCGYRSNDDRLGAMNIQQLGTQFISGVPVPAFHKLTISE